MTTAVAERSLVLGVHPTARGFGWALFESPVAIHAFAVYTASKEKNKGCVAKLEQLLDRHGPSTLVLEAFDRGTSLRSERVRGLCLSMVTVAAERGLELAVYTRGQVTDNFAEVGARTRQEVAEALARQLPALQARLPRARKAWECEDKRMALFTASALVLTHYRNGAAALLDDMRNAA